MEKAKYTVKNTVCAVVIIIATVLTLIALLSGQVTWQAVAVLISSWWFSLIVMTIVIMNTREIFGFVRRVVQHQLNGPKGNFLLWLFQALVVLAAAASVIHVYGKYYLAVIHFGNDFDSIAAAGVTVMLAAIAKIIHLHLQEKRAFAKEPVVEHERISLFG